MSFSSSPRVDAVAILRQKLIKNNNCEWIMVCFVSSLSKLQNQQKQKHHHQDPHVNNNFTPSPPSPSSSLQSNMVSPPSFFSDTNGVMSSKNLTSKNHSVANGCNGHFPRQESSASSNVYHHQQNQQQFTKYQSSPSSSFVAVGSTDENSSLFASTDATNTPGNTNRNVNNHLQSHFAEVFIQTPLNFSDTSSLASVDDLFENYEKLFFPVGFNVVCSESDNSVWWIGGGIEKYQHTPSQTKLDPPRFSGVEISPFAFKYCIYAVDESSNNKNIRKFIQVPSQIINLTSPKIFSSATSIFSDFSPAFPVSDLVLVWGGLQIDFDPYVSSSASPRTAGSNHSNSSNIIGKSTDNSSTASSLAKSSALHSTTQSRLPIGTKVNSNKPASSPSSSQQQQRQRHSEKSTTSNSASHLRGEKPLYSNRAFVLVNGGFMNQKSDDEDVTMMSSTPPVPVVHSVCQIGDIPSPRAASALTIVNSSCSALSSPSDQKKQQLQQTFSSTIVLHGGINNNNSKHTNEEDNRKNGIFGDLYVGRVTMTVVIVNQNILDGYEGNDDDDEDDEYEAIPQVSSESPNDFRLSRSFSSPLESARSNVSETNNLLDGNSHHDGGPQNQQFSKIMQQLQKKLIRATKKSQGNHFFGEQITIHWYRIHPFVTSPSSMEFPFMCGHSIFYVPAVMESSGSDNDCGSSSPPGYLMIVPSGSQKTTTCEQNKLQSSQLFLLKPASSSSLTSELLFTKISDDSWKNVELTVRDTKLMRFVKLMCNCTRVKNDPELLTHRSFGSSLVKIPSREKILFLTNGGSELGKVQTIEIFSSPSLVRRRPQNKFGDDDHDEDSQRASVSTGVSNQHQSKNNYYHRRDYDRVKIDVSIIDHLSEATLDLVRLPSMPKPHTLENPETVLGHWLESLKNQVKRVFSSSKTTKLGAEDINFNDDSKSDDRDEFMCLCVRRDHLLTIAVPLTVSTLLTCCGEILEHCSIDGDEHDGEFNDNNNNDNNNILHILLYRNCYVDLFDTSDVSIGIGANSKVFSSRVSPTSSSLPLVGLSDNQTFPVALKIPWLISKPGVQFEHQDWGILKAQFIKESLTTRQLRHPYLVRCFGAHHRPLHETDGSLILEICGPRITNEGILDFSRLIFIALQQQQPQREHSQEKIFLKLLRNILRCACSGLQFLHSFGIAHLDVKPRNILWGLPELNRAVRNEDEWVLFFQNCFSDYEISDNSSDDYFYAFLSEFMAVKLCDFGCSFFPRDILLATGQNNQLLHHHLGCAPSNLEKNNNNNNKNQNFGSVTAKLHELETEGMTDYYASPEMLSMWKSRCRLSQNSGSAAAGGATSSPAPSSPTPPTTTTTPPMSHTRGTPPQKHSTSNAGTPSLSSHHHNNNNSSTPTLVSSLSTAVKKSNNATGENKNHVAAAMSPFTLHDGSFPTLSAPPHHHHQNKMPTAIHGSAFAATTHSNTNSSTSLLLSVPPSSNNITLNTTAPIPANVQALQQSMATSSFTQQQKNSNNINNNQNSHQGKDDVEKEIEIGFSLDTQDIFSLGVSVLQLLTFASSNVKDSKHYQQHQQRQELPPRNKEDNFWNMKQLEQHFWKQIELMRTEAFQHNNNNVDDQGELTNSWKYVWEFVRECLNQNPQDRPSAADLIAKLDF